MAFWDDLTKGVSDAASFTVKKTEKLTGIAKVKLNLRMEESKLDKCYEEIGRNYYAAKKYGKDKVSDIASLFVEADEIHAVIGALRKELASLTKNVICPRCKSEIEENAQFCPVCGLKLEKKEPSIFDHVSSEDTPVDSCNCTCDCDCGCDGDNEAENCSCDAPEGPADDRNEIE